MRLVIYLLILFVIGCSKQSAKNSTKLEISSAALIAGHSGGVMLYVINKDKGTQRSLALNENKVTLELDNGNWDFAVLAWDTDLGSMESLQCAKTSIKLEDSSREVNLNLSYDACNDSFFSPPEYLDSNQVQSNIKTKELKLFNCSSVSAITTAGAGCTERGLANSYRLKLLGHPETPLISFSNLSITQADAIQSINCVNTSQDIVDTLLGKKIPFGSAYFKPAIILEAFNQENCTGGKRSYFFPHGLAGAEVIANKAKVFSTGNLAELYVEYDPVSLTPSISFPSTTIGVTSVTKTITLTNYNSSPITISSASVQAPFQIATTANTTCTQNLSLAPSSSCDFIVTFNPTASGSSNKQLTVVYNGNLQISSNLSGTGLSPANVTFNTTPLNFVNILTHTNPLISYITFTNSGETPATNFTFTMPSGFVQNSTTCNTPINQGQSCTLTIKSAYNNTIAQQDTYLSVSYNYGSLNTPPSSLQIPVSINFVATGDGLTTGKISPFYSTITNSNFWNTYVNDTSPYANLSSGECNPDTNTICQHAGDKRITKLPLVFDNESCSNLIGSDDLDVFDWQCIVGPGSQKSFRILGFKKSKGLRDLIDPATSNWLQIKFQVKKNGVLVYQNREPSNNIWWGNPIKNINALGGKQYGINYDFTNLYSSMGVFALKNTGGVITAPEPLHAFDLATPKNIYVVSQDIAVPGIHFGAANVSLVTLANAKITSNTDFDICNINTGGVAGANAKTLICAGGTAGQKHPWIEIKANGYNVTSAVSIYLKQPRFSRVHNTEVADGTIGIEYHGADKYNLLTDSEFHHNNYAGMINYDSTVTVETLRSSFHYNIVRGISIEGSNNARIKDVSTYQNGDGVYISGGSGHSLNNLKSTQNTSNGVYATDTSLLRVFSSHLSSNGNSGIFLKRDVAGSSNNIIHDSTLSSNCQLSGTSTLGALQFISDTDSKAYNLLITGNQCYGVKMDHATPGYPTKNLLQNSTLANNDDGLFISNASKNMIVNVVSVNNKLGSAAGAGLYVDSSSFNTFVNFVSSKNATGIKLMNANDNSFEKLLLLGSNTQDCDIQSGLINTISQTNSNGCSLSSGINAIIENIDPSNSFVGLSDNDSKNLHGQSIVNGTINFSSISDFFNFDNIFRVWGSKNFSSDSLFDVGNGEACTSSGQCGIWDWRLKSSDNNVLRNRSLNGTTQNPLFTAPSCPTYLNDPSSKITSFTFGTTFLYLAVEVAFDNIGNENGLCEATETCIYSPNFGYYQGEGSLSSCLTNGTNGGLSNINVRSYLNNGAP